MNNMNKRNRSLLPPQGRSRVPNVANTLKSEIGMNVAAKNVRSSSIQPEFRIQKFKWQADYANITSVGLTYAAKMMYANNLYDPDPALLTSSVAGYTDNMDFYFYCLPIISQSRVIITNREDFPVKACLLFSIQQADLLFSSTQNIIDLGENPISTNWFQIAAKGGQDRSILTLKVNLARANGNEFEYNGNAQTYSCQPTSGPAFPMFISLLIYSSSVFTNAGVGVSWQINWTTRLWSRRLILDTGPTIAKKILVKELAEKESYLKLLLDNILVMKEFGQDEEFDNKIGISEGKVKELETAIIAIKTKLNIPFKEL